MIGVSEDGKVFEEITNNFSKYPQIFEIKMKQAQMKVQRL